MAALNSAAAMSSSSSSTPAAAMSSSSSSTPASSMSRKRSHREATQTDTVVAEVANARLDEMQELRETVKRLADEVSILKAKMNQMYPIFISNHESLTQVMDPDSQPESAPPDADPLQTLFAGLDKPERECRLYKDEYHFVTKVSKQILRICLQNETLEESPLTEESQRFLKYNRRQIRGLDPVSLCSCEVFIAPDPLPCAFARIASPHHPCQDTYTAFQMKVLTSDEMKTADFFCIFDGHGPIDLSASEFCRDHIRPSLSLCFDQLNRDGLQSSIANALRIAFVRLDALFRKYLENINANNKRQGTTACLVMIVDGTLFCAYAGDSRVVLSRRKGSARQLTYDFNARYRYAQGTTTRRGGEIKQNKGLRVNGSLAVTRAIGSEFLRSPAGIKPISPLPKVTKFVLSDLKSEEEGADTMALVIASDGLYDVALSKDVGLALQRLLRAGKTPAECAQAIAYSARQAGSNDDITVGIIPLGGYY